MSQSPPLRIAVVEDEEIVSMFIREGLSDVGFAVYLFADSTAGMALVDDTAVQALVIDVGLPGVSGDQLTRDIHARRPFLPVILMTGFDESVFQRAFATDSYVRILGKPFDMPQLLQSLAGLGVQSGPVS